MARKKTHTEGRWRLCQEQRGMATEHTETLARVWGFSALKSGQEDVVRFILGNTDARDDMICAFPTGYGKSVCYLLPALHLERSVLVVSPLCSLIHDQTQSVNTRVGARVAVNFSGMGTHEDAAALRAHGDGALVVFATPERLQTPQCMAELQDLHARRPFLYLVVDEAHLVTEHGHSFRPDYLKISSLRDAFPLTPVYCFSATCTQYVRAHLTEVLRLRNTRTFAIPDARENMVLHVHNVRKNERACTCGLSECTWPLYAHTEPSTAVAGLVRGFAGGEALVLVATHREVDAISSALAARMPTRTVAAYHGGMPDDARLQTQARFVAGDLDVLVATIASFGTGVDMQRVSRVIICGAPNSVHTLVQSIGRGGRNGRAYRVDLLVCEAQMGKARAMLEHELKNTTSAAFARYRRDSFALAERLVRLASAPRGERACMAALLARSGELACTPLRVPFSELETFKACNKRAGRADRARWDAAARMWVLPPDADNAHVRQWAPSPDTRAREAPVCGRCTACTAVALAPRKRKASALRR